LPWLAAQKPNLFNAYQHTQGPAVERAMERSAYVASFIGHQIGKALFIGLYRNDGFKPLNFKDYWSIPEHLELHQHGMNGFTATQAKTRTSLLKFDLKLTDFYSSWKGRLVVERPKPARLWYRQAHKVNFPIEAILAQPALEPTLPSWDGINLSWSELSTLWPSQKDALSEWRGIYLIFNTSNCRSYVGSAYGTDNILGRWNNYAQSRDGGNKLL
jgi:hypothetical protein